MQIRAMGGLTSLCLELDSRCVHNANSSNVRDLNLLTVRSANSRFWRKQTFIEMHANGEIWGGSSLLSIELVTAVTGHEA